MELETLKRMMTDAGVRRLYFKRLSANDNSKNQVYLGPDFSALNVLPISEVRAEGTGPNDQPRFKASLRFGWLVESGGVVAAPGAQLILYPQYPEVRFSGFLQGAHGGPSAVMASREAGRVLLLGVTARGEIVGSVARPDDALAREVAEATPTSTFGVFTELPLSVVESADPRIDILNALRSIYSKGWIDSKRLKADGSRVPCDAPNCGGYTLEAELGITPNGFSEPDYKGWEVKQYGVTSFESAARKPVTLMTPEPTQGVYGTEGASEFVRRFGYADATRPNRMNFNSSHRVGVRNSKTGLTLGLRGYSSDSGKISDTGGGIDLTADDGECAATWPFAGLIEHWARKHALAAYVPSMKRAVPHRQYRFGQRVGLAVGTDFQKFLSACLSGHVYYDPGIKLEGLGGPNERAKRRNQFRIGTDSLSRLYSQYDVVDM